MASNALALYAARAGQGIGAAFVITGAIASVATAFDRPEQRARAFGLVGILSGIAMALGPSLGGAIATWFGWRWIFFANVVPCLLIAVLVPRLVVEADNGKSRPLDWLGVVLLTLALGLVIVVLLRAREAPGQCVFGLTSGVALLGLFARRQRRQEHPMLDMAVFGSRPMVGVAILLMAVSMGYWALLVYLPPFLGAAFGQSADRAGLMLLVATLPMLALPPLAGRLTLRWGWRGLFAAAMATMAAGGVTLAAGALAASTGPALPLVIIGMVAVGIGAALSHPQLSGAVVAFAAPETVGMASAMTIVARQGGFALGVAALGVSTPHDGSAAGYALVFCLAAAASGIGLASCTLIPAAEGRLKR